VIIQAENLNSMLISLHHSNIGWKMSIRVYNPDLRFDYVFLVFFETMLKSLLISIKLADCNSLQGGGEKAEELKMDNCRLDCWKINRVG
jgi:hypothetical protein